MFKPYTIFKYSCLFIVLLAGQAYSQANVDSLKLSLQNPKQHDTLKLKTLYLIMRSHVYGSKEQELYMDKIGSLAKKKLAKPNLTLKEKRTWNIAMGHYYGDKAGLLIQTNPSASLVLIDKELKIHTDNKEYNEIANTLVAKGVIYMYLQDYSAAIESYFRALKYFDNSLRGKEGVAYAHTSIGYLYQLQKDYPNAVLYYNKALKYTEAIKNPDVAKKTDLADIYFQLATVYLEMEKYNEAEPYFVKALAISRQINDKNNISAALVRLGSIQFKKQKYPEAMAKYKEALAGDPSEMYKANIYNSIGELYSIEKKYNLAEDYLKKASVIIRKINEKDLEQRNNKLLYRLYKESGQYAKSLEAYEAYVKLDSTDLDESKMLLKEQSMKYEFEKKELLGRIAQQKKLNAINTANQKERAGKNLMLYASIGIALLLLGGVVFLYYYFKQKHIINANKNSELQRKLLLTQMNPHFIFNSVDNIQSLIYSQKNEEAIDYLTKFSKLTRQILENSTENYITLSEEMSMAANYLVIQQLLYSIEFKYAIKADDTIDTDTILIPPMLTQPFIENAVRHGLKDKKEGGHIEVRFYMKGKSLFFEVADNGSGLGQSMKSKEHKSLGTQIVTERLKQGGNKAEIETVNILRNGHVAGVNTKFEIPYIYDK